MPIPDPPATLATYARLRRILEARSCVLERIATGAPLADVLNLLTRSSEEILEDVLCSVLVLHADTRTLHHGAAPSLPAAYCRAIDGMAIGPSAGSCGTCAYLGQRVIVHDIHAHPYWKDYVGLADAAGVRACWSEPIRASAGDVLGTFAMYYAEPRSPGQFEIDFIRASAHLAGVAIEKARNDDELNRLRNELGVPASSKRP